MHRVEPVCSGFFWLAGRMPEDPLREPDIANAFIFEEENGACLIDSGVGEPFRAALLQFFQGKSYDTFTLLNSHWHVDHVCNNDVLTLVQARNKRHMIRENGVPFLDTHAGSRYEMQETSRFYSPLRADGTPLRYLANVTRILERVAPRIAYGAAARVVLRKFGRIRSRTKFLSPLLAEKRQALSIGEHRLEGWHVGNLLVLDDRGHSPDSVTVYDPVRRVLLLGDLTYEFNPLWASGTYARTVHNLQQYRELVAAGHVSILGDSHNHRLFRGRQEILPLIDGLLETHHRRRLAVQQMAAQLGSRKVDELRQRLIETDIEFSHLARQEFPRTYCSTRAMIAVALREMDDAGPEVGSGIVS